MKKNKKIKKHNNINNMVKNIEKKSQFKYCNYDEKISNKFYKFLDLSFKLDVIEFIFNDDNIVVSLNLSDYADEYINSMDIKIDEYGFRVMKDYKDMFGFIDPNIYNIYKDKISILNTERSVKSFNDIINKVMSITHIDRKFKINSILN